MNPSCDWHDTDFLTETSPFLPLGGLIHSNLFRATLVAVLVGFVASARAQTFLGSDNFNDNSLTVQGSNPQAPGQYRGSFPNSTGSNTTGAWTEINQRLEYTNSSTTGFNGGTLLWVSPSTSNNAVGGAGLSTGNPYQSNWTATITVTNLLTAPASGNTFAGFEIYSLTSAPASNAFYGVYLTTYSGIGGRIAAQWGKYNSTTMDFDRFTTFTNVGDTTDVTLKMDFNASTKVLTTSYSFDSGASYAVAGSFDLDGAEVGLQAPFNNGLGLEVIANSFNAGAIGAGQIFFDNLQVIPEPSTTAALAGVAALGLVAWRRRRKVA